MRKFWCLLLFHNTEQQENSHKFTNEAEIKKTGIKAEAEDIKEETKLMTVEENVSEKLGTTTRYCLQPATADDINTNYFLHVD